MRFIYIFYILLFYETEAKLREIACPEYCTCDVVNNLKRATCESKKLVSVEIGMPPEVEILDLSYNQINELGPKIFLDMGLSNLKFLNLSNNKINQIHMFSFEGLDQMKTLDLSYNIIEYFLEQWWMSLRNLEELYLQGNNLVLINKLPKINLPLLKILDLSQSKIEHINPTVFTLLPNLQTLDISSNYIKRIHREVIIPLTNLNLLIANDNNLQCREKIMISLKHYTRQKGITYIGPCSNSENSDLSVSEIINKNTQAPTFLENNNNNNDTDDVEILNDKLGTVSDSEIFEDLDKFLNSEKFEKMRKEEPRNNTDITFDNDNIEISNSSKLKNIDEDEVMNDLDEFLKSEKNQKSAVDDTNVKMTLKPQESAVNSWVVDDGKDKINENKIIQYIEVCNGTRSMLFYNELDKRIKDIIDVPISVILLLTTIFGTLLGIVIGCTVQIRDVRNKLPKLDDDTKGSITNCFKSKKPKDPVSEKFTPLTEDECTKLNDSQLQKEHKNRSGSDTDNYEEENEKKNKGGGGRRRPKESKSPKRTRSPFPEQSEDQSNLLDNELVQDGSSPVLGKKLELSKN